MKTNNTFSFKISTLEYHKYTILIYKEKRIKKKNIIQFHLLLVKVLNSSI